MNSKIITVALVLILVGSIFWMVNQKSEPKEIVSNGIEIKIHKSPYCSCCGKWGEYMEGEGYETVVVNEEDMTPIKERLGVPNKLLSCHSTEIEGYIVEGHVPNEAIQKLLQEKPDIKGIGMAGMPSGSPGMPGPKDEFLIYEITHDGEVGELFMRL